jgi:phosphatidylglycerophosphatase C
MDHSAKHHKIVAAFDFDGTLTDTDSLPCFLRHSIGNFRFLKAVAEASPALLSYKRGFAERQRAKEALLTAALGGRSISEVEEWARTFINKKLPLIIRPAALERLRWHQNQGHRIVIVSASPSVYIKPWATSNGVHAVLSSELELVNRQYTGKLASPNCWGPEKVFRLREWWRKDKPEFVYAYGDSRGDHEMLSIAHEPWYEGRKLEKSSKK